MKHSFYKSGLGHLFFWKRNAHWIYAPYFNLMKSVFFRQTFSSNLQIITVPLILIVKLTRLKRHSLSIFLKAVEEKSNRLVSSWNAPYPISSSIVWVLPRKDPERWLNLLDNMILSISSKEKCQRLQFSTNLRLLRISS